MLLIFPLRELSWVPDSEVKEICALSSYIQFYESSKPLHEGI